MPRTFTRHNLLVQVALALPAIGVSYLPKVCLSHLIEQGSLRECRRLPDTGGRATGGVYCLIAEGYRKFARFVQEQPLYDSHAV
jgi:hypothetical protein